jgi:hypothetical protein
MVPAWNSSGNAGVGETTTTIGNLSLARQIDLTADDASQHLSWTRDVEGVTVATMADAKSRLGVTKQLEAPVYFENHGQEPRCSWLLDHDPICHGRPGPDSGRYTTIPIVGQL